jgi:hypothetical protein
MKVCKKCGYVELSKQEQDIIQCLPATTSTIESIIERPNHHVNAVLTRLKLLGIVHVIDKENTSNIWDKVK